MFGPNVDVKLWMCCRVLCIRSGASSGVHVYIQSSSSDCDVSTADRRTSASSWSGSLARTPVLPTLHKAQAAGVGGPWREINLAQTDGQNFAQKLEAIMACLMPDRTTVDSTV